jgi:hypothetical protein
MEGGPLYGFEKRVGLVNRLPPLTRRRALAAALLTWFPLLVLSALQGRAVAHVAVPFIRDFSTYTRFLLAIPLLLLAENILGPRIAEASSHFLSSGVLREKDRGEFEEIVARGMKSRDSVLAEIMILVLAYVLAIVSLKFTAVHVSTWYATRTDTGESLTWAGWWLIGFCAPFFQFLTYRWIWRLFLWSVFLQRVRGLDLQLFPTHPDGAGGLGFVGEVQRFFGIILVALSIGFTGVIANNIVYDRVPLEHFAPAVAVYIVMAVLIVIAPLTVFSGMLFDLKLRGLHQYGTLATTYTGSFHRKWIQHRNPQNEPLLGTGDIQSLADLGNSFGFIDKMKLLPLDLTTVLHLVLAGLLPLTTLLLAVMPFKEILKLIFKILS